MSRIRIAKLHENGSLDQTFDPGIGADGDIQSVSLQGDGKIIIGGEFTSYNGIGKTVLQGSIIQIQQPLKI